MNSDRIEDNSKNNTPNYENQGSNQSTEPANPSEWFVVGMCVAYFVLVVLVALLRICRGDESGDQRRAQDQRNVSCNSNEVISDSIVTKRAIGHKASRSLENKTEYSEYSLDISKHTYQNSEHSGVECHLNIVQPQNIYHVRCCSICFDPMQIGDSVSWSKYQRSCEHTYHSECIKAWLKNHDTCPYCRRSFIRKTSNGTIIKTWYWGFKEEKVENIKTESQYCVYHGLVRYDKTVVVSGSDSSSINSISPLGNIVEDY